MCRPVPVSFPHLAAATEDALQNVAIEEALALGEAADGDAEAEVVGDGEKAVAPVGSVGGGDGPQVVGTGEELVGHG